jgi:hypothetical protein
MSWNLIKAGDDKPYPGQSGVCGQDASLHLREDALYGAGVTSTLVSCRRSCRGAAGLA